MKKSIKRNQRGVRNKHIIGQPTFFIQICIENAGYFFSIIIFKN